MLVLLYRSDLTRNSRSVVNMGRAHTALDQRSHLGRDTANLLTLHDSYRDEQPVPEENEDYGSLPDYVIRKVNRFVIIIGYQLGDHSTIASMLDAHPHVVIAQDYSLFRRWQVGPDGHSDKHRLYNVLYSNSKNSSKNLQHQINDIDSHKLTIPGSWQGQYDGSIFVIGDNSGWAMVDAFKRNKRHFVDIYNRLKNTVQIPISVIHVVKNPYDSITVLHLQKTNATSSLNAQIQDYFEQIHSMMDMINTVHLSVIDIHKSDMIAKPKIILRTVCDGLQISCSEQFLQMCAHKTISSEVKNRQWIKWAPHFIDLVAENMGKYSHLKRYSFVS